MARIEVSGSFFCFNHGGSVRFTVAVAACREDGKGVVLKENRDAVVELAIAQTPLEPLAFYPLIIEEWGAPAPWEGFALVRCSSPDLDLHATGVSSITIRVTEGTDSGLAIAGNYGLAPIWPWDADPPT